VFQEALRTHRLPYDRHTARRSRWPTAICVCRSASSTFSTYGPDLRAVPGSRQSAGVSVSRACDPKAPHAYTTALRHSSCAPVSKTGRRAREAPRAAGTERVNLVPVEYHRERWTPQSTRQRRRGPAHTRPRRARDRGDKWGAGTTWSTGFALPEGRTGALARPGPDRQPTVAVVRIQGWMRHS
jgi:hypothetical protein